MVEEFKKSIVKKKPRTKEFTGITIAATATELPFGSLL